MIRRAIDAVLEFSVYNRFLVLLGAVALVAGGAWCLTRTPIDAIPDLSENQVIVWADWPGRSPMEIEDQITYPLSVNLQGLSGVKSIRATSEFGFSMINIIFEEDVEFYFARSRVLERLSIAGSFLPPGVVPYLAPDATALGQIFWYTVEGEGYDLEELRAIQDWQVRYQLGAVPGVAQVSSAGGFVREYQVDVDPRKLRAHDLSLGQVFTAVTRSNSSVGGKVIHKGGAEYLVRGYGWIEDEEDIRKVVVAEVDGIPIRVDQIATVQTGPAFRRSVLEKNGSEAVGGVVMMRYGENPLEVTRRVREKIHEIQTALPEGVRIVPFYDRTGLIQASIGTLERALVEEIVVASLVVMLVLWHVRSALVICVTLPLAVLGAFVFMYLFDVPSNIMSLSGIAISIGVLVDAGIVMTENAYHRLHDRFGREKVTGDTRAVVLEACKVVGGPIFFSIVIMLLSFAPIFVLGGIEGRMFNPLAYTKSFALAGVAVLTITVVPALLTFAIRGRLRGQEDVWLVRSVADIYRPMLRFFLAHPGAIVVVTGLFLVVALPLFPRDEGWLPKYPWKFFVVFPVLVALSALVLARWKLTCVATIAVAAFASYALLSPRGEEFMPRLGELAIMDMPTTTPNVNVTQASDDLKRRNEVARGFPEVHQVVGKSGRAETPTDPAPIDMVETVVSFRPREWWPRRKVRQDDVTAETRHIATLLIERGILRSLGSRETEDLVAAASMDPVARFDGGMRDLAMGRLRESRPVRGRELVELVQRRVLEHVEAAGRLDRAPSPEDLRARAETEGPRYGTLFDEWVLLEDVERLTRGFVDFLVETGCAARSSDLLAVREEGLGRWKEFLRTFTGGRKPTFEEDLQREIEERHGELFRREIGRIDDEIGARAWRDLAAGLVDEVVLRARRAGSLAREPDEAALESIVEERARGLEATTFLWRHEDDGTVERELDSELQVPGWGNIWTKPIINRVDMLATGVRTMVGVKVFGQGKDQEETLGEIQRVSQEIADVLRGIPGAVDVFPDQLVGENYLEIRIDRDRAARYGVNVQDVQDVIEVALGGREITMTVEGRKRFPVRVRYPRDERIDDEAIRDVLVPAASSAGSPDTMGGEGMGMGPAAGPEAAGGGQRLRQIPLSQVADVRIVPGPTMIKSEDGKLRAYVQLNVRDRDIVGFVEEARRAVDARVELPPGFHVEWSGQFEHQVRAQRTLILVFPLVLLIIFVILYMTYGDLPDTFMMFLSVPGAIAGGAIFQALRGHDFSVAVWVGYVACFGLATETGIVMLVYLREAIDRRGGMEAIRTKQEIHDAVMEGAVQRLRPKLLTEGTTILALIPMLWATGVGAEFMRPMAAPILGGILVADEVIDVFIPVLFYWDRCRRLEKRLARTGAAAP